MAAPFEPYARISQSLVVAKYQLFDLFKILRKDYRPFQTLSLHKIRKEVIMSLSSLCTPEIE